MEPMHERDDLIRRRSNAAEALYATGHRLLSSDRYADAASVYRAMLTFAPQDERGWLALGACHEGLGQSELALQLYAAGRALSRGGGRCDLARARVFRGNPRISTERKNPSMMLKFARVGKPFRVRRRAG